MVQPKKIAPVKATPESPFIDYNGDHVLDSVELLRQLNAEKEAWDNRVDGQKPAHDKARAVLKGLAITELANEYVDYVRSRQTNDKQPYDPTPQNQDVAKELTARLKEGAEFIRKPKQQKILAEDKATILGASDKEIPPDRRANKLEDIAAFSEYAATFNKAFKDVRIAPEDVPAIMNHFTTKRPIKINGDTGRD